MAFDETVLFSLLFYEMSLKINYLTLNMNKNEKKYKMLTGYNLQIQYKLLPIRICNCYKNADDIHDIL